MNNLIKRSFKIWAYTVSHGFLILRSPMRFPDQDDYDEIYDCNIDIEFTAVAYIDLPYSFLGLAIRELTENIPDKYIHYKNDLGFKVFEINSGGNIYHIVAGSYIIGENKWPLGEDRITNYRLEHDAILADSTSRI